MRLAAKISLAIAIFSVVLCVASALLVSHLVHERLHDEHGWWTATVSQALAEGVVSDTINDDAVHARDTLRAIVEHNELLRYAYLVDFDGRVFSHSFDAGFPRGLAEWDHRRCESNDQLSFPRRPVRSWMCTIR